MGPIPFHRSRVGPRWRLSAGLERQTRATFAPFAGSLYFFGAGAGVSPFYY